MRPGGSHLGYLAGGQAAGNASTQDGGRSIVQPLGLILSCVRDRRRLLELAAGLLAALTDAALCAIGLREGATFLVVGEEAGLPLDAERERELARFLAERPAGRGDGCFDIWGFGPELVGHVVVRGEGGVAVAGYDETIVAVTSMLGSCLDRQAWRDEVRVQTEDQDRLRARLAAEESARVLFADLARHLADLDVHGMLRALGNALGGKAALISANGVVLAGSATALRSEDLLTLRRRNGAGLRGFRTMIPLKSGDQGTLAYLSLERPAAALDGVAREPLEALLSAAAALQLEGLDAALGSESAFVLTALFAGEDFPVEELQRWARRLGVDFSDRHRVAFLTLKETKSARGAEMQGGVGSLLSNEWDGPRPRIAAGHDGLVCMCPDPDGRSSRRWVEAWERILRSARPFGIDGVALGAGLTGLSGIRRSYQQARSLARLQRSPGWVISVPDVAVYEEGGLAEIILAYPDRDNLLVYVRRVLRPLLDDARCGGELPRTLQVYLATGGSPAQTAELLHLHSSTVKYRLRMIRELVGSDHFEDHNRRFELEFALRVLEALKDIGE